MTPLLLTCFNRRETTLQLISKIKDIRDRPLYIFWDGGRDTTEQQLISRLQDDVRLRLQQYGLKAHWNICNQNLGCRKAIISALDWVFCHEETVVLFEDDCHPVDSCFLFMDYCLDAYINNAEIFGINSINKTNYESDSEFGFTRYFHGWGWATWRNRWIDFRTALDNNLISYDRLIKQSYTLSEKRYWKTVNKRMEYKQIDTWDFDLQAYIQQNDMKLVFPLMNLTSNVGFKLSENRDFKNEKEVVASSNFEVDRLKVNTNNDFSYEDSINSFQYPMFSYVKSTIKSLILRN